MAAKYPKEAESQNIRNVSITELEKALEQLTQEVEEKKQELKSTFQHLHQMLVLKEETLMVELDAIPADISAKIEERKESLEQLAQHKEGAEKKLQSNVLNDFLKQELSGIQNQMEKILSQQIFFPRVSLSCRINNIQEALEDNCHIIQTPNHYITSTQPIWNEGKGGDLVSNFSEAICIDRNSQLIYVGDTENFQSCKIQVFNIEGEHHSTLLNKEFKFINSMQTHGNYIYVLSGSDFYKLNKKGSTVKSLRNQQLTTFSLFIQDTKLYTCSFDSLTVEIYDLNLKFSKDFILEPISFDKNTVPRDIIVIKQQIFVLFSYSNLKIHHHPDPIQIFQLDGTHIQSLVIGNSIKSAKYFCLDSYENILVSDYGGNCIKIYSPDGILRQSIGRDGELRNPGGISIDLKGRIIILNKKGGAKLQAF